MVDGPFNPFLPGESPVGIVSGSGIKLRAVFDEVCDERPFSDVEHLPASHIAGHDGVFVFGRCGAIPVVLQAGRIHLYEGHSPSDVAATVDALHHFGVRRLILTNAVGGLDPALSPGDLVVADRVESWRYAAHPFPGPLVPPIRVPGCDATGTCMWMHGPCYETRAEIAALQQMGALTVGMSLPLELARCEALGIEAGVVSCVTNDCTRHDETLTHDHVVETAARASERLSGLLRAYIQAA